MTQLTPAFDAALAGWSPTIFGAVSIALPGYTMNLLDGAGVLAFEGRTYAGRDPTFGALASIDSLTDGTGDNAPALSITLLPSGNAAAGTLAAATMQGSQVLIHIGAVDPASGAVIADPQLLFIGELDVPTLQSKANSRELDYEVVSVFERFFQDDEGARLAPGYHKSIWPGELGLDDVTGVAQTFYWGVEGSNYVGAVSPVAASYGRLGVLGQAFR